LSYAFVREGQDSSDRQTGDRLAAFRHVLEYGVSYLEL
jgi:hypothetical protein